MANFFRGAGSRFAKAASGMFQPSRLQACTFAAGTAATAALTAQTVACLRIEVRSSFSLVKCAELSIFQEDTKLDFKDVLIRPARSNLRSRSQVGMLTELVPSVPLITVHTGRTCPHLQIQVWYLRVDWSANHRCQHGASSVSP